VDSPNGKLQACYDGQQIHIEKYIVNQVIMYNVGIKKKLIIHNIKRIRIQRDMVGIIPPQFTKQTFLCSISGKK